MLVFGSTTFATATVLAVFMGGLALGSFAAGRLSDRVKRPFLWYGLIEGAIGIWALLVPHLFSMVVPIYRIVWELFHLDFLSFSILRFLVACLILLLPTTLMGATLPLLSKFVTDSIAFVGKKVGTIYAINTLGAVLGAGVGGFILLPQVGQMKTIWIAAAINLLLSVIVLATWRKVDAKLEETPGKSRQEVEMPEAISPGPELKTGGRLQLLLSLGAIAISGAAAMIYEVCWTRSLTMVIGSSTYAFTIMLSTFLSGIFLGSYASSKFADKLKYPLFAFGALQIVLCLSCLLSMYLFQYVPWWNIALNSYFPKDVNLGLLIRFLLASVILWPLTFLLGMIFPVVVKTCARDLKAVGRSVGTVYSANTAGAIVGSILAGFAIIPSVGVEKTLMAASAVNLGVGLLLISASRAKPLRKWGLGLAGLAVFLTAAAAGTAWDRKVLLTIQAERRFLAGGHKFKSFDELKADFANWQVVYWNDGPCSHVGVAYLPTPPGRFSLITNGCVDASDVTDMPQQVLLAQFPMFFIPHARTACVVGWGSGITVGQLLHYPLQSVTAVELEPSVVTASFFFHRINRRPEHDPRVHIEYNDGRNFLLATAEKYDLIISEPSNPWQVGVCNLFTREYFSICRERLNPQGVMCLWLQSHEISPEAFRSIIAALNREFKYCIALAADPTNMIILAGEKPLKADWEAIQRAYLNPKVKEDMSSVSLPNPEDVLARLVCSPSGLARLSKGAVPNSDDLNTLEFTVGRTYESQTFALPNAHMMVSNMGSPDKCIDWGNTPQSEIPSIMNAAAKEAMKFGTPVGAYVWANASNKIKSNETAQHMLKWVEKENREFSQRSRYRIDLQSAVSD